MPVKASVASNWLSLTTAPVPPTTNAHAPNSVQVTVLFVNRTSCAKAVSPSLKANHGASNARLPSSTSPSTATPRAVTVTMSTTSKPLATSPEPGEAHVSVRSEEHTSELQSHSDLVCRLLLEKKKTKSRQGLIP